MMRKRVSGMDWEGLGGRLGGRAGGRVVRGGEEGEWKPKKEEEYEGQKERERERERKAF